MGAALDAVRDVPRRKVVAAALLVGLFVWEGASPSAAVQELALSYLMSRLL